jgi:hypothetical protein
MAAGGRKCWIMNIRKRLEEITTGTRLPTSTMAVMAMANGSQP